MSAPIAVFDSGYGGLTVLREFIKLLPQYDYIYLGDNARNPYGNRSFDIVYKYTLEAVRWLFSQNSPLVILACNTASAKALRSIQQNDLPLINPDNRVLGVIRPSVEAVGHTSKSGVVGILATRGTVASMSYPMEIKKLYGNFITVIQQDCPMWVPLVENNEHNGEGADFFVKKCLDKLLFQNKNIDTIILACTHYPLLLPKILKYLPKHITLLSQGSIVANSLKDYLKRHPEMERRISKKSTCKFYTTDSTEIFHTQAQIFLEKVNINVEKITLG